MQFEPNAMSKLCSCLMIEQTQQYTNRTTELIRSILAGERSFKDTVQIRENLTGFSHDPQLEKLLSDGDRPKIKDILMTLNQIINDSQKIWQSLKEIDLFISLISYGLPTLQAGNEIPKLFVGIQRRNSEDKTISRILDLSDCEGLERFLQSDCLSVCKQEQNNVFAVYHIRQMIETQEITKADDLITQIKNIKAKCTEKYDPNTLLNMQIDQFSQILDLIKLILDRTDVQANRIHIYDALSFYQVFENSVKMFSCPEDDLLLEYKKFLFKYLSQGTLKNMKDSFAIIKEYLSQIEDNDDLLIRKDYIVKMFEETNSYNIIFNEIKNLSITGLIRNSQIPSYDMFDIQFGETEAFNIFWSSFLQLINSRTDPDSPNPKLQHTLNTLLANQENYDMFINKLRVNYLSPQQAVATSAVVAVLDLLFKLNFKAPTIKSLTKEAIVYFNGKKDLLPVFNSIIQTLINSGQQIDDLQKESPVDEYRYVSRLLNDELKWNISYDNGVRLIEKSTNNVTLDNEQLSFVSARLNITMIEEERSSNSEDKPYENARKFVETFQLTQALMEKYQQISNFHFKTNELKFECDGFDKGKLEDEIDEKASFLVNIEKQIRKQYNEELYRLTLEQLCLAYSFFTSYLLTSDNNKNEYINSLTNLLYANYNIGPGSTGQVKDKLKDMSDAQNDFSEFEKYLKNNILGIYRTHRINEKIGEIDTNIQLKIVFKTNTFIVFKFDNHLFLQMFVLKLFYLYKRNSLMPNDNQLMICTPDFSLSRMKTFLRSFKMDAGKNLVNNEDPVPYIIVRPNVLDPIIYDLLLRKINKYSRSKLFNGAKMIIMYTTNDQDTNRNNISQLQNIITWKKISNIEKYDEYLLHLFREEVSPIKMKSYAIYTQLPRTGKTQLLFKHIVQHYPEHVYHRITVDKSTSLEKLICCLNEAPKIKDKKTVIHFNVDGNSDILFSYFIFKLAFYQHLNDGKNIPFVRDLENMIFYFEFGSRPHMDKNKFFKEVFPTGEYMEQIEVPMQMRDLFSFEEYITGIHEIGGKNIIIVESKPRQREYLIEAASLVNLCFDDKSYLNVNKLASRVKYEDYIAAYNLLNAKFSHDPKAAFDSIMQLYKGKLSGLDFGNRTPLISQISDISKIISQFKGVIISQNTYQQESDWNQRIRKTLLYLLLETAILNCGSPYTVPESEKAEADTIRLQNIEKFIRAKGRLLAITDPSGSHEDQGFKVICYNSTASEVNQISNIDPNYNEQAGIMDRTEWDKKENYQSELYKILSDILFLQKYRSSVFTHVLLIHIWNDLPLSQKSTLREKWKNILPMLMQGNMPSNLDLDTRKPEERLLREFISESRSVMKKPPFSLNNNSLKDPSPVIDDFIEDVIDYVHSTQTPLLDYTLTLQNISRFIHIIYRIYSNVPIILMGETGSGKTFTIQFLKEIIGSNVLYAKLVIDGGTTEEAVSKFIENQIGIIEKGRVGIIKQILRDNLNTNNIELIKHFIRYVIQFENDDSKFSLEGIHSLVKPFVEGLTEQDKLKYQITKESEIQQIIRHIEYKINGIFLQIEHEQKQLLLFFDEVNTAPCQWFLKQVVVDRYFKGSLLPSYIRFVCAVNPSRVLDANIKAKLRALEPPVDESPDKELKDLIYKVHHMPESFIPFIFPADPDREINGPIEDLSGINSEFDKGVRKIVAKQFSFKPYPFDDGLSDKIDMDPTKPRYGDKYHFSRSIEFSSSFDLKFFMKVLESDQNQFRQSLIYFNEILNILSDLNVYACRILHKVIYKDVCFSSLREPERCTSLMKWFYKFGIFEELDSKQNRDRDYYLDRLRRAFILALSITYYLRLSSYKSKEAQAESDREIFLKKIISKWEDLSQGKSFFKAPQMDEFLNIISKEMKSYTDLFVDDSECISKNVSLQENIWATYICVLNGIPLWIIGSPGTSKSLAVNITLNKLLVRNSTNPKIAKSPMIVYQIYMCSKRSTTEAIMNQIERIVRKGRMILSPHVMNVQILEEIGHADLSPYHPLKCLHDVIDNGYSQNNIPVTLIGLSNYKMDSAKLNRGILILRVEMDSNNLQKTAKEILHSTAIALKTDQRLNNETDSIIHSQIAQFEPTIKEISKKYHEYYCSYQNINKYYGLRDFYGLIQSLTKPFQTGGAYNEKLLSIIIERNFSGLPKEHYQTHTEILKSFMQKLFNNYGSNDLNDVPVLIQRNLSETNRTLKTPIVRHIMLSTNNNAAYTLLSMNRNEAKFMFSENLTKLPDSEWNSNEFRELTKAMRAGDTVVFVGKHPFFDGLYDIFNLRYNKVGEDYYAQIAYGGDSYPVIVNPNFRAIIIVESEVYQTLPLPFINRFEKFIYNYDSNASKETIETVDGFYRFFETLFGSIQVAMQYFGCLPKENIRYHFYANSHIIRKYDFEFADIIGLTFLNCQPSAIISFSNRMDEDTKKNMIIGSIYNLACFHSTIPHVIQTYYEPVNDETSKLKKAILDFWHNKDKDRIPGIQAVLMVPLIDEQFNEAVNKEDINLYGIDNMKLLVFDFQNAKGIKDDIEESVQEKDRKEDCKRIFVVVKTQIPDTACNYIYQVQWILEQIRYKRYMNIDEIHTVILLNMNVTPKKLELTQTIKWPLMYLDTCFRTPLMCKCKNPNLGSNVLSSIHLYDLMFSNFIQLFNDDVLNLDKLLDDTIQSMKNLYTDEQFDLIKRFKSNQNKGGDGKTLLRKVFEGIFTGTNSDPEMNNPICNSLIESISNTWIFQQIKQLATPPPSIIEFLSLRFLGMFRNALSMILRVVLSGEKGIQHNPLVDEILFGHTIRLINYQFDTSIPKFCLIESRMSYENPEAFHAYLYMWEIILNMGSYSITEIINSIEKPISNKSLIDRYIDVEEEEIINQFWAAYLLLITPEAVVKNTNSFNGWIKIAHLIYKLVNSINQEGTFETVFSMIENLRDTKYIQFYSTFTMLHRYLPQTLFEDCDILPEDVNINSISKRECRLQTFTGIMIDIVCKGILSNNVPISSWADAKEFFLFNFTYIVSAKASIQFVEQFDEKNKDGQDQIAFAQGYSFAQNQYSCNYLMTIQQIFKLSSTNVNTSSPFSLEAPNDYNDIKEISTIISKILGYLGVPTGSIRSVETAKVLTYYCSTFFNFTPSLIDNEDLYAINDDIEEEEDQEED